jgi:hypothetical protein
LRITAVTTPLASSRLAKHERRPSLVERVYDILYLRHINNIGPITANIHYIEGMAKLAGDNSPLWIFSLNHGLIVECLAAYYNVPLSCGFSRGIATLPRRDRTGAVIGELRAETIAADRLEQGLDFLPHGSFGINLLKLHGALDVFTFRDGKDLLHLLPIEPDVSGVIGALRAANEELVYIEPLLSNPIRVINEIAYADVDGGMQFLRRSLLAGAFKFYSRGTQVLPPILLRHFRSYINWVSTLVCIGYAFGDLHINQVMREWLEFSADRRLKIVGSGTKHVPSALAHLPLQFDLIDSRATDYLDMAAGIVRTRRDSLQKGLTAWVRQSVDPEKAVGQFRHSPNCIRKVA